MEIPIIVLNWNGWHLTKDCVESLLKQEKQTIRVFLADNGSHKTEVDSIEAAYGKHPQVELIFFDENLGFTLAHNRVLEEYILPKGYKWVALLNNDAVAQLNWLSALLDLGEAKKAGSVASKMLQYHNPQLLDNAGHFMLNTGEIIPLGAGEPADKYSTCFPTIGACAGAALYKVEVLKKIGVFDPHFNTGYEDAEWGLRAFLSGEECWFCPEAEVLHHGSQSIDKIRDAAYLSSIQQHIFYSFFKLMPRSVVLWNLPWMIAKYKAVLLIDIVFLRFRFLKVMGSALRKSWRNRGQIKRARKQHKIKALNNRGFWAIQSRLKFFLWFDIVRFYRFVLLRQPSDLEIKK